MSRSSIGYRTRSGARAAAVVVLAAMSLALPRLSDAAAPPPVIERPVNGAIAPSAVAFAGRGPAGATITLTDALDGPVATTTVNGAGAWSATVAMRDGTHTVTASTASGLSAPVTFDVDSSLPAIAIASPDNNAVVAGETLRITGSASDNKGLYAIRLEYWFLNNLAKASLADCPGCGSTNASEWSHEPDLTPGYYRLVAYSYDMAGNRSSGAIVNFAWTGVENTPLDQLPGAPEPGDPEVPEMPELEPPSLEGPYQDELVPGEGEPVVFDGTTEPGSTVEVYENIAGIGPIGTTVDEDQDGYWSVAVHLPTGTYGVTTRASDDDGNLSPWSDTVTFEVDAARPTLAKQILGNGNMFLPTQDVRLEGRVFDDRRAVAVTLEYWLLGDLVLRELANCPGCGAQEAAWTHVPQGLMPGYYTVKVRGVDEAGQVSTTATVTFTKAA